jgi:hypothetical protein
MVFTNPGSVFLEGDIQDPVNLVFDAPMTANCMSEAFHIPLKADQIVALFNRGGLSG